jgi:hypothetical protein
VTAVREPSSAVWGMWENEIQASTPESASADSPPLAGDRCAASQSPSKQGNPTLGVRILASSAEKDGSIIRPGAARVGSRSCAPRWRAWPRASRGRGWTLWTRPGQRANGEVQPRHGPPRFGYGGSGQRGNGEVFGLPATICLPIDRNTISWGGVPASIPDWAQRLYANTLEPERPTGWRALHVYSGEIFRFHFPEALDEPNCIPTAEAMQWALPTGDVAYAFPEVDETGVVSAASPAATDWKSEPREALEKDGAPLALHATALACDLPRPSPWFDTYTFPPSWREHWKVWPCRICHKLSLWLYTIREKKIVCLSIYVSTYRGGHVG